MGNWFVSKHNGCVWLRGGYLDNANDVINKARSIAPDMITPSLVPLGVLAVYEQHDKCYYVIHPDHGYDEKLELQLREWADEDDTPAYYKSTVNPALEGLGQALLSVRRTLTRLGCISFVASMIFACCLVISNAFLIPALLFLCAFFVFLNNDNNVEAMNDYVSTRTGMIVDFYYSASPLVLKKVLNHVLHKHGSKARITSAQRIENPRRGMRIILEEPHPDADLTNDIAIKILDKGPGAVKIDSHKDKTSNVRGIEKNGIIDGMSNKTRSQYRATMESLSSDITKLEMKSFNSDEISNLIKARIKLLDDDNIPYDEKYYESFIDQLIKIKTSLLSLHGNNNDLNAALNDLNDVLKVRKSME